MTLLMNTAIKSAAAALALALAACGAEPAPDAGTSELTATTTTLITGSETPEVMESYYSDFLSTYVSNTDGINFVAYGSVTPEDQAMLTAYINSLEARGPANLSRDEEMAFWFNLYNAKTIEVILEAYPVSSIRKLGSFNSGPWDTKNMTVAGVGEMSLNDIEHQTLRANWDEPRIHYAVNCASYGCPNLKPTPWTAETLESDLTAAAEGYINHPRGFRVEDGRVTASKIFNWYKEDFGGSKDGILAHARLYAKGDLKTALDAADTINGFEYNWNLNEN
ncbi:MAG: DUF547 domain-containing protein [Hyphomonadaceae bacterium]